MNGLKNLASITAMTLITGACSLFGFPQLQPTATLVPKPVSTATGTVKAPTATLAVLSTEGLKNMPYVLPVSGKTVILKDGAYQGESGADYVLANLLDAMTFGDLNGDGQEDAAVILAENMGGSGVFESLVVVYNGGETRLQGESTLLGDRVQINSVSIQDGRIRVDLVRHAPNDAMCCPTQAARQSYTVTKSGLVTSHIVSITQSGAEIEISIEQPEAGMPVPPTVQLQGRITMAPFENTLVYQVRSETGEVLYEGPLMVKSDDFGAPGTFDMTVDLNMVEPGSDAWLSVSDLSMADGSIVALDAVPIKRE